MQVEVKRLGEGEIELNITVEPEAVLQEVQKVFQETARTVSVPGFRPGKAPRALIEAQINMEMIRQEALERLTQSSYIEALNQHKLNPIDRAQIQQRNLQEEGGFSFQATLSVLPEIKLGEYKGLKTAKTVLPVTAEAVEGELARLRRRHASYTTDPERAIEKGDLVILDYDLEVGGEVVENAGVRGYPLEVGQDSLFPELNDALLGAKMGETCKVESRLPKTFPDPALADRPATFSVTIQEVKTLALPELDDEFAQKLSGLENLEELRRRIQTLLAEAAERQAKNSLREELLSQVVGSSEFELPRLLVRRYVDSQENEILEQLGGKEKELEAYLTHHGLTREAWQANLEREARRQVKNFLIINEIEHRENIVITEEELTAVVSRLAEQEGVSPAAKRRALEESDELESIANRIGRGKVLQLLEDSAEITLAQSEAAAPEQTEAPEHGKE
jgi:trigger factor